VTKAADIIAALLDGKHAPVVERQTGMPYGWGLWLRGLTTRLGAITGEATDAVIHVLLQRAPRAPLPRPAALNRWRAFRSLFYQNWDPPLREERWLRWLAGFITLLMHLLFVLLLVLFALIRVVMPEPVGESSRVQVEFIGEGTPQEQGGGPPAEQSEAPAAAAAAQTATAEPASAAPATEQTAEAPPVPQDEIAEPSPPAAQQNLQVTETPAPTIEFVLPPTTPRIPQIAPPQIRAPEIGVPTREVTVVQAPPAQRELPQREIAVPQVSQATPQVREREIPAPLPQIRSVQIPARAIAAPELRAPTPSVRQAEIAAPNPAPAAAASSASSATATADAGASTQTTGAPAGTQPGATGTGPAAANRPGALSPAAKRGDDWDAAARNTPGQPGGRAGEGPGLFNADGSVRVPSDATGDSTRPGAPGSRQQQRADADRGSKWLERVEYPYDPTMFDKFWVPNESLLEEWVRKNIREVSIPVPGSSKKVRCVVSLLQLGGGCMVTDPNLNEQPAEARPPPDIPVKRQPIPTDS
jgi:hypothetical protein